MTKRYDFRVKGHRFAYLISQGLRVWITVMVLLLMLALSGCGIKQDLGSGPPSPNSTGNGENSTASEPPRTGQTLPAFALSDRDGQTVKVPEVFSGRAVYLLFFSAG